MTDGALLIDNSFLTQQELKALRSLALGRSNHRVAVAGPAGRVSANWSHLPLPAAFPAWQKLVDRLGAKPDWSSLYYLEPGAAIHPHRDLTGARLNKRIRFHVPIITNDGVDFRVGGERVKMDPGELWCLDTSYVHSVTNNGHSARVHLIIECAITPRISAMLPPRRYLHEATYVAALAGAFAKAVTLNVFMQPERFAAQMRMVGRFLRWRVMRGAAG